MAIITVRSQAELDMIPLDTNDVIRVEFGTPWVPAVVRNRYKYRVEAWGNSSVLARGNSSVEAWENSSVEAWGNSSVVAWENSSVVARGNSSVVAWENSSVEAWENSSVVARGNSSVLARGNSSVLAWGNSSVVAWGNSSVEAWGNSSVEAWGNSSVVARGNSSVLARGNSSVEAWENSSVEAWENSSVEAWGNSSVEAWGNTQIVDYMEGATIQLSDNARTVYMPRNVEEYMNFYGIKHDKTHALFFKAVHLIDGAYCSDKDRSFHYNIGQKAIADGFDTDPLENCGQGIHFSHMGWALNYGRDWSDLAIIEVKAKIKDVLLPKYSHGKVRAPQVEVIREVPLDECGVFAKILLKRRKEG